MTTVPNDPQTCPPNVCPVKWLRGEHFSDCDHPWHLTHKSGLFAEPPAEPTRTEASEHPADDALDAWWHDDHFGDGCDFASDGGASMLHAEGCVDIAFRAGWDAATQTLEAELQALREADIVRARDISRLTIERDTALEELERLAGPPCPHDQKRAIEHSLRLVPDDPIYLDRFQSVRPRHARWFEGEEWLRRNVR